MNAVTIRDATPADAERLLAIYAWYVEETAITFEYDVPTLAEFRGRMERTLARYPYLIAEENGAAQGYAYAGPLSERGLVRRLYQALEGRLRRMGVRNLYACIAYPRVEDEYLTRNSAEFHAHLGFVRAGTFRRCGNKFGRWYDMIWMEKLIGGHGPEPDPVWEPKD